MFPSYDTYLKHKRDYSAEKIDPKQTKQVTTIEPTTKAPKPDPYLTFSTFSPKSKTSQALRNSKPHTQKQHPKAFETPKDHTNTIKNHQLPAKTNKNGPNTIKHPAANPVDAPQTNVPFGPVPLQEVIDTIRDFIGDLRRQKHQHLRRAGAVLRRPAWAEIFLTPI